MLLRFFFLLPDPGGLPRYPIKALIPTAFVGGETERYIFALFITLAERLRRSQGKLNFDQVHGCLNETFAIIEDLKNESGVDAPSLYNLVLTDGKAMIATRYSTQPEVETRSLHLAMNAQCYICEEGNVTLKDKEMKMSTRFASVA